MNMIRKLWRLGSVLREYRAGHEVMRTMPVRLWIDTCARCNLRCVMCPNKDLKPSEKGLMDMSLFTKIIDEAAPFVHDVNLHHRGEPLLNPALFDMIRYARERGVSTRFHTNGTLMDEAKAEKILDAGPDLVSFSIDGFEKQAYEAVRIGATFEKTVDNVFNLLRRRRERRLRKPYIVIEKIRFHGQAVSEETQRKADELKRRFLEAGADEVIEKQEYVWAGDQKAREAGDRTYSRCTFLWYAMVIAWNGDVTPCPQDFWDRLIMGNVREHSLAEVWNGPAYRDMRHRFLGEFSGLPEICRTCDRLCRKTVSGLPFQYMYTFLIDNVVGYNRLRRMLGTAERG